MAGFGAFLTCLFLPQEEEQMKQMLNALNISDFISKCKIIYIYLIKNSQAVKKGAAPKKAMVKTKVAAKKWL